MHMRKIFLPAVALGFLIVSCKKSDKMPQAEMPANMEEVYQRACAAEDVLARQIAEDPLRAKRLNDLELYTQQYRGNAARNAGTLYVPVVVHIVLPNPALVTDAQIQSQIDVLNRDYTKTNIELANSSVYLAGYSFASVANCSVKFVRVQTIRKTSAGGAFGTNDAVKKSSQGGSDAVSPGTRLNLWVCDLGSGLLGYAQFPGGPQATDGVVIDHQGFGTTSTGYSLYSAFNLGRTATHEIGHWFNLRHIWGDTRCGNDLVDDTPQHDGSNAGCPAQGLRSKCSGKPLEQWMNYMDYTDDRCMYMFSSGQKTRMDAAIDGARSAYVSTTAPTPVP